ncbi:MAG: UDP-N-acetylmuramoyl-L-alanyl-D-glutamate--2,6-diaminopimelate ligase [Chloroflexi bacterium]|nr:UDP-N-acetylmuramoyl-L-alanyl-D-glutamate--2,6-diaminopimelate ligase [Chloroflexota bacterium]
MQDSTRSLKQLLADWQTAVSNTTHLQSPAYDGQDVQLAQLTEKTSEVAPGSCFVARVRTGTDGHPYIGKAIELGASMILAQRSPSELGITVPDNVVYLQVADTAETLAWLSAAWYGFPSRDLIIIGITGTNGKTTTANIMHTMLQAAGIKAGLLSTLKAVIGNSEEPLELHVTTPEAPVVQKHLRRMVNAGMTHCVLETTSHSLAQHRVTAVDFDIAVITNITHEHLDYHQTWEAYTDAKTRLFEMVAAQQDTPDDKLAPVTKTLIINKDDPRSYGRLSAISAPQTLAYSINDKTADWYATNISLGAQSTTFTINTSAFQLPVTAKLFGLFNVHNILAAATAVYTLGATPEQLQAGIGELDTLYGRMHPIQRGQSFLVMVDFAHTPDGLEKAIDASKRSLAHAQKDGRVITVFGSAGKRDPEKRRIMAEISGRDADLTILTAEDPRTESLDDILEMMAYGCKNEGAIEGTDFWRIPDRGQAIYFALTLAQPDDLVLICGKGHEQSMCFVTTEYPWDDVKATETALDAILNNQTMPNLGLPTFNENFQITIDNPT